MKSWQPTQQKFDNIADKEDTPQPKSSAIYLAIGDLESPKDWIYWAELFPIVMIGWPLAFLALKCQHNAILFISFTMASALLLYRGLFFIHEIAHFKKGNVVGFETIWNLTIGVPFLIPSVTYVGVHMDHHRVATYGTIRDPEYLPFAHRPWFISFFVVHSMLIPIFLVFRFLILGPLGLISKRMNLWMARHITAFSMHFKYVRQVTPALMKRISFWQFVILIYWAIFLGLIFFGRIPWLALGIWYAITATGALINVVRALAVHRYESKSQPMDKQAQVEDSIDTLGGLFVGIWAPIGMRYHALHHFFPTIPYHNLRKAYGRLQQILPEDSYYRKASSPNLWQSLHRLFQREEGAK